MTQPAKPWSDLTPDQKGAVVKPLLAAGKCYTAIADELGAPSRSSVAGVVNRLRASGKITIARTRQSTGADAGIPSKIMAKRRAQAKANKASVKKPRQKPDAGLAEINIAVRAESRAEAPGIAISRAAAFDPIPGVEPVPYGSAGCKFPVDGLDGSGLLWCGADRGDHPTYCASHRRLAFTPRHERAA